MDRVEQSISSAPDWKAAERRFRYYVDKSVPHLVERWIGFTVLLGLFLLRIFFVQGYYVVSYGLGIYYINQVVAFLTPQSDPDGSPSLPTRDTDEFKPFIRKLPEFKFWYALTKGLLIALTLTLFRFFNIPAYWPILVVYWLVLFSVTMRTQVKHMIKYKYIPFSIGKKRYYGKKPAM